MAITNLISNKREWNDCFIKFSTFGFAKFCSTCCCFCHVNFQLFCKIKTPIKFSYKSKCASIPNLMKQPFHSRFLGMRLVIAYEARTCRAELAIYHLIASGKSHGMRAFCKLSPCFHEIGLLRLQLTEVS